MDNSLNAAALAGLIGAATISSFSSISSVAAAQPDDPIASNNPVASKTQEENYDAREPQRMSWEISHGVGIDVENADDPLFSSRLAVKGIPLTSGRIPLFGRPSIDLYGMIESPVKGFVSDTRESLLARINLLAAKIELNRPSVHKDFFDLIQLSPELRVLRTRQSRPQLYGGGSVNQRIISSEYNLEANARFGFHAGPDYLVSAGGDFILETSEHLSVGANLEVTFPGANNHFAGYLSLGPKFFLNSSNHGLMLYPYFMLNGLSVSKADVRNRELPPMQAGLNVGYYGYELFSK